MHVCQIMLVEAEDGADAISEVKGQITYSETPYPAWSDWHEVGGRWDGLFDGWEAEQNALCYAENPLLAEDIIKEFVGGRKKEMARHLAEITAENFDLTKMVEDYDPNKYDYGSSMPAWTLARLGKLLANDWTSDTGVYDLKENTANLEFFRTRLAAEPSKQFLVPVDFHF
jgi:hypothetical protein